MACLDLIHKNMLRIKKAFFSWTVIPGMDQSHEPRIHQNPINSGWTLLFVLFNFTLSYTLDLVMSNQMSSSASLSQKTPSWPPVTPWLPPGTGASRVRSGWCWGRCRFLKAAFITSFQKTVTQCSHVLIWGHTSNLSCHLGLWQKVSIPWS